MPRFHFHVLDGTARADEEGTELVDLNAAKAEAVKLAGEILRDSIHTHIWTRETWQLIVNDSPSPDSGRTYCSLTLRPTEGSAGPAVRTLLRTSSP
jgi:flagellar biosynthesis regulator FlaF